MGKVETSREKHTFCIDHKESNPGHWKITNEWTGRAFPFCSDLHSCDNATRWNIRVIDVMSVVDVCSAYRDQHCNCKYTFARAMSVYYTWRLNRDNNLVTSPVSVISSFSIYSCASKFTLRTHGVYHQFLYNTRRPARQDQIRDNHNDMSAHSPSELTPARCQGGQKRSSVQQIYD